MAVQVVTQAGSAVALSNSVRTQYIENYLEGAMVERLYDQIAMPVGKPMEELKRGSSVQVEFLSDMTPGTTAISEVVDITPQTLVDATASLTPTSRAEALQASELLLIQAFTDYHAKMAQRVGKNMIETVDSLARNAATQGSLFLRNAAARTALDAGSTGHRADDALFFEASAMLQTLRVPGFKDRVNGNPAWPAIMHPYVYHDLLRTGNVITIAQYQSQGILFNHELGSLGEFRPVVSPWAKVFLGAGATNAKSVDTVVTSSLAKLDTTLLISNTSSVEQGDWLNILDTRETGATHVHTNERVKYASASNKTITVIGGAANGGINYAHAAGVTINNNDSAYTIIFGGPDSLAKVYATEVGEYGQIVGPKMVGTVDQWVTLGWKWYGGYGRLRENGLLRAEVSVSAEAA